MLKSLDNSRTMVIGKVHLPLISACYQAYLQIYNLHDFK